MAQVLLDCGVNDLGGTLMNESISTTAGAKHGQLVTPSHLRHIIAASGRTPVQRDTVYTTLQRFDEDHDPTIAVNEPLNAVSDAAAVFGSYDSLTLDERHRFRWRN